MVMRLRVVKRLTAEEMQERLLRFERKHIRGIRQLQKRCAEGKASPEELVDYLVWSALLDAYGNYLENGELNYLDEEYHEAESETLRRALTLKRLELLFIINSTSAQSISELASRAGRDVKNVYEDLMLLKEANLVRLVQGANGKVTPQSLVEEIHVLTR